MRSISYAIVVLCLLITSNLRAQCDNIGGIFINEIGNLSNDGNHVREFIELVVLEDISNPGAPVNLEGWILDDNNASQVRVGNEPGHIVFGDCFNSLLPGTIILIYNDAAKFTNIFPENDGMNALGFFQVPISSDCLLKIDGCPTQDSPNYNCEESALDPDNQYTHYDLWNEYIPMRNLGDLIQLRNPNKNVVHGLSWIENDLPGVLFFPSVNSTFGTNFVIHFTEEGSWYNADNFIVSQANNSSPGQPNSPENAAVIENIASSNENQVIDYGVYLVCFSPDEEVEATQSSQSGSLQLYIDSGIPPFQVEWNGPSSGFEADFEFTSLLLENLPPGTYQFTVSDFRGCSSSCSTTIVKEEIEEVCLNECETIGEDLPDEMCYYWDTEYGFDNNLAKEQVVCPTENTSYSVTVTDDNGNLVEVREYEVQISPTIANILPNPAMLCTGITPSLMLSVEGEYATYNWDTGSQEPTIEVYSVGTYSVTVTTEEGCVAIGETEVRDPSVSPEVIEEYFANLGFVILPIITLDEPESSLPSNGGAENMSNCLNNHLNNEEYSWFIKDEYVSNPEDYPSGQHVNLGQLINDFCDESTDDVKFYLTDNDDFCDTDLIQEIETLINSSDQNVTWMHVFNSEEPKLILGGTYVDYQQHLAGVELIDEFVKEELSPAPPTTGYQDLTYTVLEDFMKQFGMFQEYATPGTNTIPKNRWLPYITRLGRIVEATAGDAMKKNKYRKSVNRQGNFSPTLIGGYRQPDFVSDVIFREIVTGWNNDLYRVWLGDLEPALYNEVKMSKGSVTEYRPNVKKSEFGKTQIRDFIESLNKQKKIRYFRGWLNYVLKLNTTLNQSNTPINPANHGMAVLQFITLANNEIEDAISNKGIEENVRIYHTKLEYRVGLGGAIYVRLKYPGQETTTIFPTELEDSLIENLGNILGVSSVSNGIHWWIR